jgi:quinol monooxygenase YgiN
MSYGYLGSIRTRPGYRDEVVKILLRGVENLRVAGCLFYLVGAAETDPELIWVSEVWQSKLHHDESLTMPEAQAAIAEAMPMLTGEFSSHELSVLGGLGL